MPNDDADDGDGVARIDPLAALTEPRHGWRSRLDEVSGGLAFWPSGLSPGRLLAGTLVLGAIVAAVLLVPRAAAGDRPPLHASAIGTSAPPAIAKADTTGSAESDRLPGTTAPGIWVAVAGAVTRTGLYRVRPDARVSELLVAAGGLAVDADPDRINLAAALHDGERIYVPRRGEATVPDVVAGSGMATPPVGSSPSASGPSAEHPVNLNTASVAELDALPGVGPATAAAIVDHRTKHGPFASVDDLKLVRGIGPAKLDQLRELVTV